MNSVTHVSAASEHFTSNSIFVPLGMLGATKNSKAFSRLTVSLPPIVATVVEALLIVTYSDSVAISTVTLFAAS